MARLASTLGSATWKRAAKARKADGSSTWPREVPFDRTPWYGVIVTDPDICSGKVRITRTRHYIDFLVAMIEGGYSFDYILAEYPQLERAQLEAMMGFVRDLVAAKWNGLKGDRRHG